MHPQGTAPPVALFTVTDDSLTKAGEWFVLEIIAEGNRFVTKVNGQQTASCDDPLNRYHTGHFVLQVFDRGTSVQFRKIEIKELPPRNAQP
jgi:hypothetical protein